MTINHGGPAFPVTYGQGSGEVFQLFGEGGMTLRQWYAGMALQAIISKAPFDEHSPDETHRYYRGCSEGAFRYADAMLAHELSEKQDNRKPAHPTDLSCEGYEEVKDGQDS